MYVVFLCNDLLVLSHHSLILSSIRKTRKKQNINDICHAIIVLMVIITKVIFLSIVHTLCIVSFVLMRLWLAENLKR